MMERVSNEISNGRTVVVNAMDWDLGSVSGTVTPLLCDIREVPFECSNF